MFKKSQFKLKVVIYWTSQRVLVLSTMVPCANILAKTFSKASIHTLLLPAKVWTTLAVGELGQSERVGHLENPSLYTLMSLKRATSGLSMRVTLSLGILHCQCGSSLSGVFASWVQPRGELTRLLKYWLLSLSSCPSIQEPWNPDILVIARPRVCAPKSATDSSPVKSNLSLKNCIVSLNPNLPPGKPTFLDMKGAVGLLQSFLPYLKTRISSGVTHPGSPWHSWLFILMVFFRANIEVNAQKSALVKIFSYLLKVGSRALTKGSSPALAGLSLSIHPSQPPTQS